MVLKQMKADFATSVTRRSTVRRAPVRKDPKVAACLAWGERTCKESGSRSQPQRTRQGEQTVRECARNARAATQKQTTMALQHAHGLEAKGCLCTETRGRPTQLYRARLTSRPSGATAAACAKGFASSRMMLRKGIAKNGPARDVEPRRRGLDLSEVSGPGSGRSVSRVGAVQANHVQRLKHQLAGLKSPRLSESTTAKIQAHLRALEARDASAEKRSPLA